jgi:predicted metal-binding protein
LAGDAALWRLIPHFVHLLNEQENQIHSALLVSSFPFVRKARCMAKRRGNPNWGKPEPIGPIVPTITEFEQVVREYKLTPDQYLRSTRLREWARRNKNSKYIPEPLLEAWGFEIESTL